MEQQISREMDFFMYLIEAYAAHKNRPTSEVLKEWDRFDLTDMIFGMYEKYHVEAIENAFEDIDQMVKEKER